MSQKCTQIYLIAVGMYVVQGRAEEEWSLFFLIYFLVPLTYIVCEKQISQNTLYNSNASDSLCKNKSKIFYKLKEYFYI